jgi:hypothetical protein
MLIWTGILPHFFKGQWRYPKKTKKKALDYGKPSQEIHNFPVNSDLSILGVFAGSVKVTRP